METPDKLIGDAAHDAETAANYIREGRFQRSLALLTAATSVISGLEVAYEHYRGSYSRRVMYTPVILSAVLGVPRLPVSSAAGPRAVVLRLAASSPWSMPGWVFTSISAAFIASPADGGCR